MYVCMEGWFDGWITSGRWDGDKGLCNETPFTVQKSGSAGIEPWTARSEPLNYRGGGGEGVCMLVSIAWINKLRPETCHSVHSRWHKTLK